MICNANLVKIVFGAMLLSAGFSQRDCPQQLIQCFIRQYNTHVGEPFPVKSCASSDACSPFACDVNPITTCNQKFSECANNCGSYNIVSPPGRRSLRYVYKNC